jgi:hypothetical protein
VKKKAKKGGGGLLLLFLSSVSEIYTVFACRGGRNAGKAVARLSLAEKRRREFLKHSKQTSNS